MAAAAGMLQGGQRQAVNATGQVGGQAGSRGAGTSRVKKLVFAALMAGRAQQKKEAHPRCIQGRVAGQGAEARAGPPKWHAAALAAATGDGRRQQHAAAALCAGAVLPARPGKGPVCPTLAHHWSTPDPHTHPPRLTAPSICRQAVQAEGDACQRRSPR